MENQLAEASVYHGPQQRRPEQIDLIKLAFNAWKGIKAWWWLPCILALAAGGIRYLMLDKSYEPYYQTSATVYVDMASQNTTSQNLLSAQQMVTVFPYLVENGVLLDAINTQLGIEAGEARLESEEVLESIAISANESTNLLTFQVTGDDPEEIHELLEAVIEVFPDTLAYIVGPTTFTVFRDMGVPVSPANPKPTWITYGMMCVKAVLAAFFIGLVFAGLYGISLSTVSSEEELRQYLNIDSLGTLPAVALKKRSSWQKNQLLIENPLISFRFGEALRSVRTRFERIANEWGGRTALITSTVPGEGKTTIAVNLALSLAQMGRKVLLIDADLRNPHVAELLQITEHAGGLSEVLTGEASAGQVITILPKSGLYVMTAGKKNAKSVDLLSSHAMEALLEEVSDYADYVIVDSAPVMVLSDSIALAKYVDGALYVVRHDLAKGRAIRQGFSQIAESGCRVYGTILNDQPDKGFGYGIRYGKYGGYGKYGSYRKYGKYGHYGKYGSYGKDVPYGGEGEKSV